MTIGTRCGTALSPLKIFARCGLILSCMLLAAGCAAPKGKTDEKPLVISKKVEASFKEYEAKVQSGKAGAFAVNKAGYASYYATCESGACGGYYNFSAEALAGCRKYNQGECVVLASNGVIKRQFTVGDTLVETLAASLNALAHPQPIVYASGGRIRQAFSGNSIVERDVEGRVWAEYFSPDGTLRGRASDGRRFEGAWKIDGNTMCVDYRSIARDWCGQFVEAKNGDMDYYVKEKFRKTYSRGILRPGNPESL